MCIYIYIHIVLNLFRACLAPTEIISTTIKTQPNIYSLIQPRMTDNNNETIRSTICIHIYIYMYVYICFWYPISQSIRYDSDSVNTFLGLVKEYLGSRSKGSKHRGKLNDQGFALFDGYPYLGSREKGHHPFWSCPYLDTDTKGSLYRSNMDPWP